MRMLLTVIMILTFAGSALAQAPVIADFEGGVNNGDWTWGNAADYVATTGGNPGGYFGNDNQMTAFPVLRSGWDAPGFSGDLTNAVRISADLQTIASSNQYIGEYYFCVFFRNNMGTPSDITDDVFVYIDPYQYDNPDVGEGWKHYEFDLPFDFQGAPGEVPAGWVGGNYYSGNTQLPSDVTFQDVVSNVSRIEFWYNHPDWAAIFATHHTAVDNIVLDFDAPVATEESSFGNIKAMFR
jgi:hypothetical protein